MGCQRRAGLTGLSTESDGGGRPGGAGVNCTRVGLRRCKTTRLRRPFRRDGEGCSCRRCKTTRRLGAFSVCGINSFLMTYLPTARTLPLQRLRGGGEGDSEGCSCSQCGPSRHGDGVGAAEPADGWGQGVDAAGSNSDELDPDVCAAGGVGVGAAEPANGWGQSVDAAGGTTDELGSRNQSQQGSATD